MTITQQYANIDDFNNILKHVINVVSLNYENITQQGAMQLNDYLANAKITDTQKADIFTKFVSGIMTNTINQAIAISSDLVKFNADLAHRAFEIDNARASIALQQEQLKQEQYKTNNILPVELQTAQTELQIKQQEALKYAKDIELASKEIDKISKEMDLLTAQIAQENKKAKDGGIIDAQTELYREQATTFTGYNLAKAGDSIAQIISMIVAEGGTPNATLMTAHSSIMSALVKLGGLQTLSAYNAAK